MAERQSGERTEGDGRERRLAAALRANLGRRKAQARARAAAELQQKADDSPPPLSPRPGAG